MKRHPALVSLSRDHHHALVLAREARRLPADAGVAVFVAALVRRFEEELAPHFAIEERELVRRCVEHGEPLASLSSRVVADHDALRAMMTSLAAPVLAASALAERCDAFGARLEEHIRFEEREWFPALEERLGGDALTQALAAPAAHSKK